MTLLVDREVHISNLLVACEVGDVARHLTGAGGAIMWSVKTTGVAIPPVVVSFDRVSWVVALSKGSVVVVSPASSGIAAVVACAATILWWCRGGGVGLVGG